MCGIGGKVSFENCLDEMIASAMCNSMSHRGPDSSGVYANGPALLAHTRLSIIDLTDAGAQPMANRDGDIHIVFNGEIYNYPELRDKLDHYNYTSETDTEVILAAYEEWGTDCLTKLRGMFAFGLWDETEEQLFLARDRLGQKPLFLHTDGETLGFASTLSALLADESVPVEPDYSALREFLTYQYVPHPKTGFEDIERLEPGEYLMFDADGMRREQYWSLSFQDQSSTSVSGLQNELESKLREAVSIRMMSDVPLGVFLSGGVDSTIVTHLMDEVSDQQISTYSIGFDTYDELDFARQVAKEYDTDHHEYTVEPDAVEILPEIVRQFGMPFGDPSAVPTYYVSKMASQDITVAVGGDAGDENFAGYDRYTYDRVTSIAAGIPKALRRSIQTGINALPTSVTSDTSVARLRSLLANANRSGVDRYAPYICHMLGTDAERVWNGDSPADELVSLRDVFNDSDGPTRMDRLMQTDIETYLPDDLLVKVDRAGMSHSMELRSPFLDHELIEFTAGVPARYKWRRGKKKWLLKETFRGKIPDAVVNRSKQGFSVPVNAWFRDELADTARKKLNNLGTRDQFDSNGIREILEGHINQCNNNGFYLWDLIVLEIWFEQFIDPIL